MQAAAALSEHPVAADAAGEVLGQVLESIGPAPDLAVLFATPPHIGALGDVVGAVRSALAPTTLLGATGEMVLAGRREVEGSPALALWAARTGPVVPVRMEAHRSTAGVLLTGIDQVLAVEPAEGDVLLLLAEPFSFPVEDALAALAERAPGLQAAGGLASAARGQGGNRLVLDGRVVADGAVGALLRAHQVGATVVSQGCRPIGEPVTVTRAERQVLYELAGRPALERLSELVSAAKPDERELLGRGIHIGVVVDEHRDTFRRGDFLVRNVLGGDRETGAIAVAEEVPVGAVVQFHVRDAASAEEDLRSLLEAHAGVAPGLAGALVFTCNGRGTHLFGIADHDATVVQEALGAPAAAGMSCAGEIGPIAMRTALHGFTAVVLTFP